MTLHRQISESQLDSSDPKLIPMTTHWIGSWEVAISRRPHVPKDLASQYDAVSESWSRTARRFKLETAYQVPLLACGAVAGLSGASPIARVLDCGIGTGSLSMALNNISLDPVAYYGIDVSSEMLSMADVEMRKAGISPQLQRADILSIPHADQSFDVVMAAHVLEHLREPQRAISEMIRVLKPGGLLFVCMTRRSLFGTLIQLRWRTWAVSEQQGVAWLRTCQLKDIGCQPVRLGSCAGQASTAFWARKPSETFGKTEIEPTTPNADVAP